MQPPRGTYDLMPRQALVQDHIIRSAQEIALRFGFVRVETPLFEHTEVFEHTGASTDIVTKQLYKFHSGALCLRPEGTAGIVRMFLSNKMQHQLPLKFFYYGPMFRHERPQKGRYRQFYQIGAEFLGAATHQADAENIAMAQLLLQKLSIPSTLLINTLGSAECRALYKQKLVEYLEKYKNSLSAESQARIHVNPLRVLDSKHKDDQEIKRAAPKIAQCLNAESQKHFDQVLQSLNALGVSYKLDPFLVRGLDYYCHSVFEFCTSDLGAQNALLAGGRYDKLVEQMGGRPTQGAGWAAGVERLAMLIQASSEPLIADLICLVPHGVELFAHCMQLAHKLRAQGLRVDMDCQGNTQKRLARASKKGAKWAIVVGQKERPKNQVSLKNLQTRIERLVDENELVQLLKTP